MMEIQSGWRPVEIPQKFCSGPLRTEMREINGELVVAFLGECELCGWRHDKSRPVVGSGK
jgi:hypothetical protein